MGNTISVSTFFEHERQNETEIDDLKYRVKELEDKVEMLINLIEVKYLIYQNK